MHARAMGLIVTGLLAGGGAGLLIVASARQTGPEVERIPPLMPDASRSVAATVVPPGVALSTSVPAATIEESPAPAANDRPAPSPAQQTYWWGSDGRPVLLTDLTDQEMLEIVRDVLGSTNVESFPEFKSELKRRGLETEAASLSAPQRSRISESAPRRPTTPTAVAKEAARPAPAADHQVQIQPNPTTSAELSATLRLRVLDFADRIAAAAVTGKRLMKHHRETIVMYRGFQATEAKGKLQAIDNLAQTNARLYKELDTIARTLQQSPRGIDLQFYATKVKSLTADIDKNNATIDRELARIKLVPKPLPNPNRRGVR
jgi:hypothetical protein